MRNIYTWDAELSELVVTQTQTKSLEDIQRVIELNKPQSVIDSFIELYLPTTDTNNKVADDWYKQHQLAETLPADQERKTVISVDELGNETTETLPNDYEVAVTERGLLELSNPWLLGYRGIDSIVRPEFIADVDTYKAENNINELLFKRERAKTVENIKVDVDGISLDGDETSQNRLARAGLGMLAAKLFAIETVLRTSTTTSAKTLRTQLVSALDDPRVQIQMPWVAADNSTISLDSKNAIEALSKAGQAQAAVWMK